MNIAVPSMTDRPFGAPPAIVHVLDLPYPPSVNRIWRNNPNGSSGVYLSAKYKKWKQDADDLVMAMGGMRGRKTIYGHFTATIELKRRAINHDLDNRIKAVLDYAQRVGLVVNDSNLVEIRARWTDDVPTGCRLTLRSVG